MTVEIETFAGLGYVAHVMLDEKQTEQFFFATLTDVTGACKFLGVPYRFVLGEILA